MIEDAELPSGPHSPIETVRCVVFIILVYGLMAIMGVACFIPSMLSRRAAVLSMRWYCVAALWLLRVMIGTRVEFRGQVPDGPCIVASKHQSFLDIMCLMRSLPSPSFVMKKSLRWAPILGVYAARIGSIPIDRRAGSEATRSIIEGAKSRAAGRQIIIFPQGTRVHPKSVMPYRRGFVRLYAETGYPLVPVAVNAGWYWPRTGIRRTPGTVVIEFLDPIPPGQPVSNLLELVADRIESASVRLAHEAVADLRARGEIPCPLQHG